MVTKASLSKGKHRLEKSDLKLYSLSDQGAKSFNSSNLLSLAYRRLGSCPRKASLSSQAISCQWPRKSLVILPGNLLLMAQEKPPYPPRQSPPVAQEKRGYNTRRSPAYSLAIALVITLVPT